MAPDRFAGSHVEPIAVPRTGDAAVDDGRIVEWTAEVRTHGRVRDEIGADGNDSHGAQASVSATAPAGTRFVRVFAYGSASAGVRSTFAYDGMGLTAA